MIASGEKKEEYREIKFYWMCRLIDFGYDGPEELNELMEDLKSIHDDHRKRHDSLPYLMDHFAATFKKYTHVEFKNGYGKNVPTILVEVKDISVGLPAFKWFGAQSEDSVFIIHLGNIV